MTTITEKMQTPAVWHHRRTSTTQTLRFCHLFSCFKNLQKKMSKTHSWFFGFFSFASRHITKTTTPHPGWCAVQLRRERFLHPGFVCVFIPDVAMRTSLFYLPFNFNKSQLDGHQSERQVSSSTPVVVEWFGDLSGDKKFRRFASH